MIKFSRQTYFKILTVLFGIILIVCLEAALRFFYPALSEDINRMRLRADQESSRAYSILKEPDPYLFWRQKPHQPLNKNEILNRYGFRGPEFSIRKSDSTYRIVCLGDSRSFGFGVEKEQDTYCGRLRRYLNQQNNGTHYEVINLSVLGYSSFQGKRLLETFGLSLSPDMVLSFFGFNDMLYFHITDEEAANKSKLIRKTQAILNNYALYHLLRRGFSSITNARNKPIQVEQRIVRRVPLESYRKNLRDIAAMAHAQKIPVGFITTVVRKEPPLVLNAKRIRYKDDQGRTCEKLQAQYLLDSVWLMNALEFPGEEKSLDKLLAKYPELPILHYFKGIFLQKRSEETAARIEFETAEALDDDRATIRQYNNALKSEAAMCGAQVIDLEPIFSSVENVRLFDDDCHPNSLGHSLITGEIVKDMFHGDVTFANE